MLASPTNDYEKKLVANIKKHGLQVNYILGDDEGPPFAYSIGLWHTYKHAEVLLHGVGYESSLSIINDVGAWLADGNSHITVGTRYSDFLDEYDCVFCEVPVHHYENHVGSCRWAYGGNEFPLLQLVWPSKDGLFPWEQGATDSFRKLQPVLSDTT